MPNIAAILKAEITRLARKETKAAARVLKKANAQYRRDIARLKREGQSLKKTVEFLESQERKRLQRPVPVIEVEGKRFSANWLKSHREKLGVAAADYAELVGVSAQTIYNWENGRAKPRKEQLAALVAVRGLGKREVMRRLEG